MNDVERSADIETLARIAARLAGRDPDEHLTMTLGQVTAFDDYIWRYPDFLNRAEAAYAVLNGVTAPDVGSGKPAASMSRGMAPLKDGGNRKRNARNPSNGDRRAGRG